jgi:DNA-binding SARP family transcriptional activator/predicted negative regulator of RcsB-dependent stress response
VLLTRRGEFVPREILTEALWPRRAPADPAANLRVLVNLARRAFGDPDLLLTRRGGYSFAGSGDCVVDAEVFLGRVKAGHREMAAGQPSAALREFQAALDLWAGEPLAENARAGWAQEYRNRLGRAHGQALEAAGAAALALRHIEAALSMAELAVARDPLKESGQLLLVHALAAAGDVAGALASLDAFRRRFAEELGIDLSPEAAALQARLLRREPLGPVIARRPSVARGLAVFEELPFVGREQELATILFALSHASPSTVVVSGIAGVGKSRLLSEVATRSVVPVIAARAFLPERDDAWALARSLLREALAMDYQAAGALPDRPAQALAELVPELEDLRPLRASSLDPESRRALALKGSALLMWALGAQGTLVVVDDLQWADGSSLDLLGLIIRRAPIQMVLAYRPEEVDKTGSVAGFLSQLPALGRHVTTVALEPLRPEAISELVPDEELAAVISEATDRTPHALGELIRALAREGSIQSDEKGRWRARRGDAATRAREVAMAGQARAVQRRATVLPPGVHRLLLLLALLGREAPARLLARASDASQAEVLADLDAASRAGLVRLGEKGWAVAHDLIGEALAENLLPIDRAQLHEALAAALSAEDEDASEIAPHLEAAGDAEAAARAFARAGRLRLDRFAGDEAERLAERGLRLNPKPESRAELLEIRGEVRARRGDLTAARDDLRAALAQVGPGAARAHLLARLAMLTSGLEDYLQAGELVELALTEALSDPPARAEALAIGAIIDANTGHLEQAASRADEALGLFEQIGDAQGVAGVLEARATSLLVQGRLREAVTTFSRAADLFQDAGQLLRLGTTQAMRAFTLVLTGRADEALAQAETVVELARMLECIEGEGFALTMRGFALAALGKPEEATSQLEETLVRARRFGHREHTLATLLFLSIAQQATGHLQQAEANLREALQLAERLPLYSPWVSARLASVLIAQGHLSAAESFVVHPLPGTVMDFEVRLARTELAIARGDPDAAETAAQALALAEEAGHLFSASRLRQLLGPPSHASLAGLGLLPQAYQEEGKPETQYDPCLDAQLDL